MTGARPLVLPDAAVESLGIPTADVLDAIEAAIRSEAAGGIRTAPKSAVLPGDGRYMMTTLSTADDPALTVVKSVEVAPGNAALGLPAIEGAILVQDSTTGRLVALMGSGWVTAVRTAGLSGVAARRLADPASRSVGFIGTGVQARSHLDTFAALFPLERIRAYGRGRANLDRLCEYARGKGLEAEIAESPRDAISDVDLVVTSVTLDYSIAPFLDARWMKPGAFAAITDLAIPWAPEGMPAFGQIWLDDLVQEAASPKRMVAPDLVSGDLKGLIGGDLQHDPARPAAFCFRGIAIGDFAVAALVLERARAAGIGQPVDW